MCAKIDSNYLAVNIFNFPSPLLTCFIRSSLNNFSSFYFDFPLPPTEVCSFIIILYAIPTNILAFMSDS